LVESNEIQVDQNEDSFAEGDATPAAETVSRAEDSKALDVQMRSSTN